MPLTLDKLKEVGRRISGVAMTPLVHREALSKAFPETPKEYSKLPAFYLDHLKSLFKDPKKLRLALTDVTPLGIAGIATAIPMIHGLAKLMPHRRVQTITGGIGNILGGQLMQRTGLIGSGLGGVVGEALGRLIGSPFDRAPVGDASTLAASMAAPRIQKAQELEEKVRNILGGGEKLSSAAIDALSVAPKTVAVKPLAVQPTITHAENNTTAVPRRIFDAHIAGKNVGHAIALTGPGNAYTQLDSIHVDPAHRQHGVGNSLMTALLAHYPPEQELRLKAEPYGGGAEQGAPAATAEQLQQWYRRYGFVSEPPGHAGEAGQGWMRRPGRGKALVNPSDKTADAEFGFSTRAEGASKRYDVHQHDKNVAYAVVRPKSTEGDGPWVSGLYVKPEHRGQGLAKRLLENIETDHKGQTVRLRAKPYKDKGMDKDTLVAAYKRWGYAPYDPDEPTRLKKDAGEDHRNDSTFSIDKMTYPVRSLHENLADVPTTTVPLSDLVKHLRRKVWSIDLPEHEETYHSPAHIIKLIASGKYPADDRQQHDKRISDADLNYPIAVSGWGNPAILDGIHRLAKARAEGHKEISVKVLPEIPEQLKMEALGQPKMGMDKDTLVAAYKRWGYTPYDPDEPTRLKKDAGLRDIAAPLVMAGASMLPLATGNPVADHVVNHGRNIVQELGVAKVQNDQRRRELTQHMESQLNTASAPPPIGSKTPVGGTFRVAPPSAPSPAPRPSRWSFKSNLEQPGWRERILNHIAGLVGGQRPVAFDPGAGLDAAAANRRLKAQYGKTSMEHQGIREPNPTTHDASIGGSSPYLADIPRQYGDARSVANRGKWRPDVNTLSEALMLINPSSSIMAKDRFTDPTTGYNQMDGLHHDPVQIFDPTHQSVAGISGVPGKRIKDRGLPET